MNPLRSLTAPLLLVTLTASALVTSCSTSTNSGQYPGGFVADQSGISYLPPKIRFRRAIRNGGFAEAAKWARPEYVNEPVDGKIPVVNAVLKGRYSAAFAMADKGANCAHRTPEGESLATVAAMAGYHQEALQLARYGASLNDRLPGGESLAFYAASRGEPGFARQYAALGAGSYADAQRGSDDWNAKAPARAEARARNAQIMAGFLGALINSAASGPTGRSSYEQDLENARNHEAIHGTMKGFH